MSCIVLHFVMYLLFLLPLSLSIDLVSADDVAVYDYVADDQAPSAEQPGKQNPLDLHISPTLFSLIIALEMPCYYSDSTYSECIAWFFRPLLIPHLLTQNT